MSRGLHDRVQALISRTNGFTSVGALVRYMMSQYVLDPGRYDDLTLYQDRDNDVRSSVWADRGTYATFQTLLSKAGLTVTDAVKSLLMAYEATVSASTESQE
jgi:hypothetical protein